jgi:hypothetical protein
VDDLDDLFKGVARKRPRAPKPADDGALSIEGDLFPPRPPVAPPSPASDRAAFAIDEADFFEPRPPPAPPVDPLDDTALSVDDLELEAAFDPPPLAKAPDADATLVAAPAKPRVPDTPLTKLAADLRQLSAELRTFTEDAD